MVTGGTGAITFTPEVESNSCGTLVINSDGSYEFSPSFGFTGVCSGFSYLAAQGGCSATGPNSITFTVASAPIATGENFNVCPGVTVTGNLNTLVLPPLPPPPISFTGGPGINGTLVLNPAGPFVFTPDH